MNAKVAVGVLQAAECPTAQHAVIQEAKFREVHLGQCGAQRYGIPMIAASTPGPLLCLKALQSFDAPSHS